MPLDAGLLGSGYLNIPKEIIAQIKRGEIFYLAAELYLPTQDNIFSEPEKAMFRFSDSKFRWNGLIYKDKVSGIPELNKFIGKTFNTLNLDLVNVERLVDSASRFAFANLVRGYRIGIRIIFPTLNQIELSRLIWWGRVSNIEDITEKSVKIVCSQEIGDFSYELAKQQYGEACPLWFGKGECLGNQTLEEKSLMFQDAFNTFGQGGCDRTFARCNVLGNDRFYQGQKTVTITGQFFREEITKTKFLFFFTRTKKTKIPVQYSSTNQSENDKVTIPIVVGRARIELHAFTWADIGTQITALMGACKGKILGFYNTISHNPKLTVSSITEHLGELGGEGTQQLDPRFPQSGYNSRLAYLGVTYDGSPADDEPEELPATTSVIKGMIMEATDRFGQFIEQWSNNPVWVTRFFLLNFPYTVIKKSWFNENKNIETANRCFRIIEDDTDAEQPIINGNDSLNFANGEWTRYASTSRINARSIAQNELSNADDIQPDIWWASGVGPQAVGQSRTYLALANTCNGVINDTISLSDLLYGLVLPTFRGFLRFNHFGQVEIDMRKPADNSFVRVRSANGETRIGVQNVTKFRNTRGYLLIGVGKSYSEIGTIKSLTYVNGCALTEPILTLTGSINGTISPAFIERQGGPSEIFIDFSGTPNAGDCIHLQFNEPSGQNELLTWDYYVDESGSLDSVTQMFAIRLMASPVFRETWTAEVLEGFPNRVVIRCQTGYINLNRSLLHSHEVGEEVLRVVEIYEDGKDPANPVGIKDNMKDFVLNVRKQEVYHAVTGTYISAVQDFRETQIQPRVAWDAAEQERNLHQLELDLRLVDNYRQAAFLVKSATIDFVDGNLYSKWGTGILGLFHEEGDVVAVRHQTMQGLSYTPFSIEDMSYSHSTNETNLGAKLYLSAAFDERIAKEEKFFESSLTRSPDFENPPAPVLADGGYSTTGTGDGGGGIRQNVQFETYRYETIPSQQVYSPNGADKL